MLFNSILFPKADGNPIPETKGTPDFFRDLNLDQIVEAVTARKEGYDLAPFFYRPCRDREEIEYRQQVMRDLEDETVLKVISSFAEKMRSVRQYCNLSAKLYYRYNKEGWFLEAVDAYCDAVEELVEKLAACDLRSRGLTAFRWYLTAYVGSEGFIALKEITKRLKHDLAAVHYCLMIKNNCIKVRKYEGEIDYSAEVSETFAKFQQGAVKDYRVSFPSGWGMNHVEAGVLELVAKLYPAVFSDLDGFYRRFADCFMDEKVAVFEREVQFYLSYLEYISPLKEAGLKFCYPRFSESKEVCGYDTFDLALAHKLLEQNSMIVSNDFYLHGCERVLVVTGPNQGGKTTFARTFGQLHYLGSLGLPVPGKEAQLFLFDRIFTHFEREEGATNRDGKLQDDLTRMYLILKQATPNSIVIINEVFTSTTLQDAVYLSQQIMKRIMEMDLLCVCVTFIDELASLGEKTVSMVSGVMPENPALRTYKIERRPANGLSYALSIAEKYRLTYERLKERIK